MQGLSSSLLQLTTLQDSFVFVLSPNVNWSLVVPFRFHDFIRLLVYPLYILPYTGTLWGQPKFVFMETTVPSNSQQNIYFVFVTPNFGRAVRFRFLFWLYLSAGPATWYSITPSYIIFFVFHRISLISLEHLIWVSSDKTCLSTVLLGRKDEGIQASQVKIF